MTSRNSNSPVPSYFLGPYVADPEQLAPQVVAQAEGSLLTYWQYRIEQHLHDSYAGVRMMKFPEDLITYEHVMWLSRPQVVVELGTHSGGSALWFRDRLRTLAAYGHVPEDIRVISVDLNQESARAVLEQIDGHYADQIVLVEGDVLDPLTAEIVAKYVPAGARCLVVEDTQHTYATSAAALRDFARFVPVDGFFVVEDGVVDSPELCVRVTPPGEMGGVTDAVRDWLAGDAGAVFQERPDLDRYGVSCRNLWLQRSDYPEPSIRDVMGA